MSTTSNQEAARNRAKQWDTYTQNHPTDLGNNILTGIAENTGLNDIGRGYANGDPLQILAGLRKLGSGPNDSLPDEDPLRDKWIATNTSYSGADVVPIVQINGTLITMGSVQTISISTHREKEPIRVLGKSYVKGYTGGPRTIAGSITFTLFNRDPFWEILKYMREEIKTTSDRYHTPIGDQIPPVNLILWFSNEYGRKSLQTIYGMEFVDEGQVHSINDVYSEKTVNYVARDMDILIDYDDVQGFRNLMYERQLTGQFTDNYLTSLLSYRSDVQKRIQDCNVIIQQILLERDKRTAIGVTMLGLNFLFGDKSLREEYTKQVKLKTSLVGELENTNLAISNWSKTVYEGNDYFGSGSTVSNDTLRQAPNVGATVATDIPLPPVEAPQYGNVTVYGLDDANGGVRPVHDESSIVSGQEKTYNSTVIQK